MRSESGALSTRGTNLIRGDIAVGEFGYGDVQTPQQWRPLAVILPSENSFEGTSLLGSLGDVLTLERQ